MNSHSMSALRLLHFVRRIFVALVAVIAIGTTAYAASNSQAIRPSFTPNDVYADFDGDLKLDLVRLQGSTLQIQRSDGSELRFATSIEDRGIGFEISVADLDDDDDLDIIFQNRLSKDRASVWINDGTGSFTNSIVRSVPDSLRRHRSWSSVTRENENADLIEVEQFDSIFGLPSAELPSRISQRSVWHIFSTSNELSGHNETFHLRGPPSTFCA